VTEPFEPLEPVDLSGLNSHKQHAVLKARELGLGPDGMILALFQRESEWDPNNHGDFSKTLDDYTSFGYGQLRVERVQDCINEPSVQIASVNGLTTVNDPVTRQKMKAMDPLENIDCALYHLQNNSTTSVNYYCSTNSILSGGPDIIYSNLAAGLRRHNGTGCLLNKDLYPARYITSSGYYAWDFVPLVVAECDRMFSEYGCDISTLEIIKEPATVGQSVPYYYT
tara:strand:+ start:2080 stop:2754 length:675 start_codon:yes stop_codon:yes gene_type:complete